MIERRQFQVAAFLAAFVAAFCTSNLCSRASAKGIELSNRISLGYDSFIDRFTIVEEDTSESVHDYYAALANSLSLSSRRARIGLNNLLRYGNQSFDESLDLDITMDRSSSWKADIRSMLRSKSFLEGSDYANANDFVQGNLMLRAKRKLPHGFSIAGLGRWETTSYRERTIYDYDYRYWESGLEVGTVKGTSNAAISARIGRRTVPDTTTLSFDRAIGELDARLENRKLSMTIISSADRRDYIEPLKSDYWLLDSRMELEGALLAGRSLAIKAEMQAFAYDRPDSIYFDSQFMRLGLKVRQNLGKESHIYIEPRYARLLASDFPDERYWEGSIVIGFDSFGYESFWLAFSYEPGYRDYYTEENLLYSDTFFNRVSLMGSMTFARYYNIDIFLDHEPERHSRREDDFSMTLVSCGISRRF